MMRYTQADRAYLTKLNKLCRTLVASLQTAATANAEGAKVVEIFSAVPHNTDLRRSLLADAFRKLDTKPSSWGNGSFCQAWHSLLRSTRNDPTHGTALMALWAD